MSFVLVVVVLSALLVDVIADAAPTLCPTDVIVTSIMMIVDTANIL
jgi:hypothetical protein